MQLVALETADNLRTDGLYVAPRGDVTIIHIHGKCGNFYQNDFLKHMFAMFEDEGLGFLTFNHRGHDCIAEAYRNGTVEYIGGSTERFADCVLDIDAAIDFARRDAKRVVIQGHSNGSEKALHYSLAKPDEIDGVVLISASDSYEMQRRYRPQEMPENQAKRLAKTSAARQGITLLDFDEYGIRTGDKHYPIPVTRDSLLDTLTGPGLNALRLSRPWTEKAVQVPALLCVGEHDPYLTVTPRRMEQEVRDRLGEDVTLELVLGADHHFHGFEEDLAGRIIRWTSRVMSPTVFPTTTQNS